ncbi:MAG: helix-turn-helix transcriptional regulator [Cyclobacteriaceae bacterium]|nr:helix-turn-helix transcriptional regulator [Cyclobacteriaceae bacterium]
MRKTTSTNFKNEQSIAFDCPITSTLKMVGGRWKLIILWQLKDRQLRYKELHRAIPNISEKMLTQQLQTLVDDGWVIKKDYKEIPPRTEYYLSELGRSFVPILKKIFDWGMAKNIVELANSKYGFKQN